MTPNKIKKVKGFISYSHEDAVYFEKFKKLLETVIKSDKKGTFDISIWTDKQILAGEDWHDVIQEKLKDSDFAILLISNDFFGGEYIEKQEYTKAKNQNKLIIPVELTPVIDRNQFEGLGKIQWFTYTKFSRGETLGLKFDNEGSNRAWQSEYINTFYTSLVNFLKENIVSETPQPSGDKILKVRDIPHIKAFLEGTPLRELKTVSENDLVVIASNRMKKYRVRHLLVLQDKELKGILSRRDIVKLERGDKYKSNNIVIPSSEFKTAKVLKVMIKNVISCDIEDNISLIVEKFGDKQPIGNGKKVSIGTLAVKNGTDTIEILSYTDILSQWKVILNEDEISNLELLRASSLMTDETEVQRLSEDEILAFGYDMVTDEADPRRAIPIVASNNPKILRGMISDLRVFSVHNDNNEVKPIKDFMREKDIDLTNYFDKVTSFEDMIDTFRNERDLTSLPVIEGDELVGIVSYTSLIKKIAEQIKARNK